MFQTVVFLIVAVFLYWLSDRILRWIEASRGGLLENRTLVFFAILLCLSVGTFGLLGRLFEAAP